MNRLGALSRIDEDGAYQSPNVCFGGGGGGNTNTIQKSDPWSAQQPYLEQIMGQGSSLYNNPSGWPQFYSGQNYVNLNPEQIAGQNAEFSYGASGGSPAVGAATNFETNLQNGAYLDPTQNPNWQAMANNVTSSVVPQLEAQFTAGNGMNSPGAAYAVSKGATDALGNLAGQQYGNVLSLMNNGAAWAVPGLQGANLSAIGAMQDAGNQQYQQAQNVLQANEARWNYNQTLPWNMLNNYNSLIQGNYGGTTNLQTPYFTNPIGGALTGAVAGGVGGGALAGATMGQAAGPYGAAAGAIIGGLYGGLSS